MAFLGGDSLIKLPRIFLETVQKLKLLPGVDTISRFRGRKFQIFWGKNILLQMEKSASQFLEERISDE